MDLSNRKFSRLYLLLAPAFFLLIPSLSPGYMNNQNADVAIGQPNMTSNAANQGGGPGANTLKKPGDAFQYSGQQFIADTLNSRVLIYDAIPTANNASANIAVGQPNLTSKDANQGGGPAANTLNQGYSVCTDGTKLIVADTYNHRILIYNSIPSAHNADADMAVGQPNLTSNTENQGLGPKGKTLSHPAGVFTADGKLFIADAGNHRVLIYNTIPTAFNTYADVIVGQADQHDNSPNQGGAPAANTLYSPSDVYVSGSRLFISDMDNHRVLIFNTLPLVIDASADLVIGQADMTSNSPNQGGSPGANTLNKPLGVFYDGARLFVADNDNHRVLIYNGLPGSNNANADRVLGQPNFVGNLANQGGGPAANTLNGPVGLFADTGQVAVCDYDNHRVLLHADLTPTPTSTPTPVVSPTLTPSDQSTRLGEGGGFATPNPFLPGGGQKTTFNFTLQNLGSNYMIRIMRMNGRRIRTLQNMREWDGRDERGCIVEGGVYLYQIEAEGRKASGTVVLLEN